MNKYYLPQMKRNHQIINNGFGFEIFEGLILNGFDEESWNRCGSTIEYIAAKFFEFDNFGKLKRYKNSFTEKCQ